MYQCLGNNRFALSVKIRESPSIMRRAIIMMIGVRIVAHPATDKAVSAVLLMANDATALGPRAACILDFGLR